MRPILIASWVIVAAAFAASVITYATTLISAATAQPTAPARYNPQPWCYDGAKGYGEPCHETWQKEA